MKRFPLVLACPVMKNNKNVSMIARSASCFGVEKMIITGQNRVDDHISRNCDMEIEKHNSLMPVLKSYKAMGYEIWALEQDQKAFSPDKIRLCDKAALLVVGNECRGVDQDILVMADRIFEIQLYGLPHSLNVAMASTAFLYEYARQMQEIKDLQKSGDICT